MRDVSPIAALVAILSISALNLACATDVGNIAGDYTLVRQSQGASCPRSVTHSSPSKVSSTAPIVYALNHENIKTSAGACGTKSSDENAYTALVYADVYKKGAGSDVNTSDPLIEAILRTSAIVGVELSSDRSCGNFQLRKGAVVAFINSPKETKFLDDFPGLADGKTVLVMAEADVENPQRCVYQSAEDLSNAQSKSSSDDSSSCFPAFSQFHLASHGYLAGEDSLSNNAAPHVPSFVRADEIDYGTELSTGRVLAFTHREHGTQLHEYIEIVAEGASSPLVVSPGHYVILHNGRLRAAKSVRVGHKLLPADTSANALVVTSIRRIASAGRFNPHTISGVLHVDGFSVSCYTTAVHPGLAQYGVKFLDAFLKKSPPVLADVVTQWLAREPLPAWVVGMLPTGPEEW